MPCVILIKIKIWILSKRWFRSWLLCNFNSFHEKYLWMWREKKIIETFCMSINVLLRLRFYVKTIFAILLNCTYKIVIQRLSFKTVEMGKMASFIPSNWAKAAFEHFRESKNSSTLYVTLELVEIWLSNSLERITDDT